MGVPLIDTVTVAPSPTVTATPSTLTLCEGSNTGINLSGTPAGTTFSWIVAQNNTNGATNAVGNTINQTLFCNTPSVGSATFTVTPNFNGCAGPSIPVLVNVNPIPVVTATPNSATICTGSAPTITLTSSVANTTYNWTVVQTGISGASAGSGSIISQTLSTTGLVPGNAVYTITPTANNCSGTPIQVTVIVNPYPTATATPSLQTICSGSAPAILLASNVIGTSFSWVVTPNLVAGASNSAGALINQALTTTGNVSGTVLYTVTPDVSGCAGNSILVTVNVNPTPVVTATPVATVTGPTEKPFTPVAIV